MKLKEDIFGKGGKLETAFLLCWYITIASAAFGDCLFRVKLPIGGHFFLFRGTILLTCLLYLLVLLKRRQNPLTDLSRPEIWFVVLMACMLVYGTASILWSMSISAWFSKLFMMCQMFALSFIFIKICRDPKVLRVTMILLGVTVFICAVGGFIECFTGPFFDTPYRDYSYVFFNKAMYAPIFTSYNPNGMAVLLLFSIETLYLWMGWNWGKRTGSTNQILLWLISVGLAFSIFLCCADGGRLAILSIPIILLGLAVWLLICYKKGLLVFLIFFATLSFVYVGENYNQVRFYMQETGKQIQQFLEKDSPGSSGDSTSGESTSGESTSGETPPDENIHGTLNTIIPTVTGENVNESIASSDGIRLTLLKNSIDMLKKSHGLGIGLGNAELMMAEYANTNGVTDVHCFFMEVAVEFGVFALIPFLLMVISLARCTVKEIVDAVKRRDRNRIANILLLLFTAMAYPFLSTANSSSWGIVAMWIYIAMLLLYTKKMEENLDEVVRQRNL